MSFDAVSLDLDAEVVVTKFGSVKEVHGEELHMTWPEFGAWLRGQRRTYAEARKAGKLLAGGEPKLEKPADLALWSPVSFRGRVVEGRRRASYRSLDSVRGVSMLAVEFDEATELSGVTGFAGGLAFVAHTTWNSMPESERWRLVMPLSRPVSRLEHAGLWALIRDELTDVGLEADAAASDASRAWYVPASVRHREAGFRYESAEGGALDVEAALGTPLVVSAMAMERVLDQQRRRSGEEPSVGMLDTVTARALAYAGELGPALQRGGREVARMVRCPNAGAHSDGGRRWHSSTVLFPARERGGVGWVDCRHAHCRPEELNRTRRRWGGRDRTLTGMLVDHLEVNHQDAMARAREELGVARERYDRRAWNGARTRRSGPWAS